MITNASVDRRKRARRFAVGRLRRADSAFWRAGLKRTCIAFAAFAAAFVYGCSAYSERPEISPAQWAPPGDERQWTPRGYSEGGSVVSQMNPARETTANVSGIAGGQGYDLPALVDLALARNPETRSRWESARAEAASFGQSEAAWYPAASIRSANGYERIVAQVPKHWGVMKNWQSQSLLSLDYTLLDFGRRANTVESSREQLIGAVFAFDRQVQTIVFSVEKAFYTMAAAQADVAAAEVTLRAVHTDRMAADERLATGLATRPEDLLASQREEQAGYDLENARFAVAEAQADMAVALGVRPTDLPEIATPGNGQLPTSLNATVDEMIDQAMRKRPDLRARLAAERTAESRVNLSRDAFYPQVDLTADYGTHTFDYAISNPPTMSQFATAPEYAALMTVRWDAFTGFDRVNGLRKAEAERESTRAELTTAAVAVSSEVWRAYYAFATAAKRYQYAGALLKSSQATYDSNLKYYRRGLATVLDLLSAERTLAGARYEVIQSRADMLVSAAAIAYATGATGDTASP